MSKYVIGLDYGTLSGRAVVVDVKDGRQLASAVYEYPHAVMDRALPTGEKLPPDWALQHPKDYLEALYYTIPAVVEKSGVNPEDIIALGVDFTSSTVLPVDQSGEPLCFKEEFAHEKHAYVKLWKHHGAQEQADRMTRVAVERKEPWLINYGGKVSSEWALPKLLEVMEDAPNVYAAMDEWIEALDWVAYKLTGKLIRSYCAAGYKFLWNKHTGFPAEDYFAAINPDFRHVMRDKVKAPIQDVVTIGGTVTDEMAEKLHLPKNLPVTVGVLDAHAGVPAVGMTKPGQLMIVMGTSACFMALSDNGAPVDGICGALEDGVLPGYFCYEAGQSCMGDHYAWLVKNAVPQSYYDEAQKHGMHIQAYLTELAEKLRPGESGLLALDWWNGNRSILVDFDLTGMMLGMTLQTRAEEMYRALIEATAYGSRMIVENFRESGVAVNELFATGGISQKNAMAMQIYADVLNMPVRIAGSDQGPALGSAILAAAAVGSEKGGYDNAFDAIRAMAQTEQKVYMPIAENVAVYEQLFREYRRLHDYFGRGENDVMKRLKKLRGK